MPWPLATSPMGKPKKPAVDTPPASNKKPAAEPVDPSRHRPVWRVRQMDFDGPFGFCVLPAAAAQKILSKLGDFEGMTWQDIERGGSHNVSVEKLSKAARDRLTEINQDDLDELFSLRLSGKERIWGIRDRAVLRLLWWDPEHEVCPSIKKHT